MKILTTIVIIAALQGCSFLGIQCTLTEPIIQIGGEYNGVPPQNEKIKE